jgi:hypothetical protein
VQRPHRQLRRPCAHDFFGFSEIAFHLCDILLAFSSPSSGSILRKIDGSIDGVVVSGSADV